MGCGKSKHTVNPEANIPPQRNKHNSEDIPLPQDRNTPNQEESDHQIDNIEEAEEEAPAADLDDFLLFAEFPTNHLLKDANRKYAALGKPLPRDEGGELLPYPSKNDKSQIFNLQKFKETDQKALQFSFLKEWYQKYRGPIYGDAINWIHVPLHEGDGMLFYLVILGRAYAKSLQEETAMLVNELKDGDELAKARVLFRWLASQDLETLPKPLEGQEDSTLGILASLKEGTRDYAQVYLDMCRFAGVQGVMVRGRVKSSISNADQEEKEDTVNHWAAIVVHDHWYLVDPLWSSCHMVGGSHGEWELIDDNGDGRKDVSSGPQTTQFSYNDFYFFTNPEEMIYTHLPDDEKWQLLARPVTRSEFYEMAFLREPFFSLNLRLLEHKRFQLQCLDGEIDIRIGTPLNHRRSFMYRLWMSNKDKENQQMFGDLKLERFCFMQQRNGALIVRIFFPVAGKFKLELFGRDDENSTAGSTYRCICVYVINCERAADDCHAFPENSRREWGPGYDLQNAGLQALSHEDGLIETDDGTVQLRFRTSKPVDILHDIHSNDKSKADLKNYAVHQIGKDEIIVNVCLPHAGDFAFNLYAKEEGADGSYPNVCSYLLSTNNPISDQESFPEVPNGRVGQSKTNGIELILISHDSPMIQCPEEGELNLKFLANKPVDTLVQMELQTKDGLEKKENYTWNESDGNEFNCFARFPQNGTYVVKIYAKEKDQPGTFTLAYTCVVYVSVPSSITSPFPKAYGKWGQGSRLLSSQSGVLPSNEAVKISAVIPGAHNVLAWTSQGHTRFTQKDDATWEGEVATGEAGQQVQLAAEFEEGSKSFSTLLEFQVGTAKENTILVQEKLKKEAQIKKAQDLQMRKKRDQEFQETKAALLKAIETRNLAELKAAVKNVQKRKYTGRLETLLEEANRLIKSLDRIERLRKAILSMDQATMSEIRRYNQPPKAVHQVMIACLLLLGDHEGHTRDWKDCQKLCIVISATGLNRRVKEFQITSLHPEIAARAAQILAKHRVDIVNDISAGAGTFLSWAQGMIEECMSMTEAKNRPVPANLTRQKELLGP